MLRSRRKIFPFLSLPAELRNAVYKETLISNKRIEIDETHAQIVEPGLLAVCSQIRNEAKGLFYACNTFKFAGPALFTAAIQEVDKASTHLLTSLLVEFPAALRFEVDRTLELTTASHPYLEHLGSVERMSQWERRHLILLIGYHKIWVSMRDAAVACGVPGEIILVRMFNPPNKKGIPTTLWVTVDEFQEYVPKAEGDKLFKVRWRDL